MGSKSIVLKVSSDSEIETAFTTLVQRGADALLAGATGGFLYSRRERIVALAAGHRIPAIYINRDYVAAGGLMSYAPSITDAYREAGIYAGRRRREFIGVIGGMAAWPALARAQSRTPVVGFLHTASAARFRPQLDAFHQGLKNAGYVDRQNVAIEYRWADGQLDRLPELAADLVRRNVAVIASTGGNITALVAKAATATIPIVFTSGADPVKLGLVTSLNRPGGNLTGASFFAATLGSKALGLLHEVVPKGVFIAVLINPKSPEAEHQLADIEKAARELRREIQIVKRFHSRRN